MNKQLEPPLGYNVEHREPATPFGNPWVIYFNGERVGSAPTKAAALELASEDAKSRAAKPKMPAKPPKTKKAVHEFNGVNIVEWENARKGQQFQVIDPHGYHYRYAYTLDDAQDIVERVLKWGW